MSRSWRPERAQMKLRRPIFGCKKLAIFDTDNSRADTALADIIDTVKPYIIKNLADVKSGCRIVTALELKSTKELLFIFLNWKSRFVPVQPRLIYESSAFCNNPIRTSKSAEIEQVISEIKAGVDLTPRLSNRITKGFVLPRKKSLSATNRPDLDLLLNDWGIHHLHIALRAENGTVERTSELIFVIFKGNKAYLIDIYPHGKWSDPDIVKTVVKAWPDENFFLDLGGLEASANGQPWTEEELQCQRNAGIATWVEVGRKIFIGGGGTISNAGFSNSVNRAVKKTYKKLINFEADLTANPARIKASLREYGNQLLSKPIFEYCYLDKGIDEVGIVEKTTRARIDLV
jgi:hypothetical protein